MYNPLLDKFYELHPEKKEEPKVIKAENAKVEIKGNSSGVICAKNPPSLTIYDLDSGKDAFLQIAEKVKNGTAQVSSINMEMDIMSGTKINFEVMVYGP